MFGLVCNLPQPDLERDDSVCRNFSGDALVAIGEMGTDFYLSVPTLLHPDQCVFDTGTSVPLSERRGEVDELESILPVQNLWMMLFQILSVLRRDFVDTDLVPFAQERTEVVNNAVTLFSNRPRALDFLKQTDSRFDVHIFQPYVGIRIVPSILMELFGSSILVLSAYRFAAAHEVSDPSLVSLSFSVPYVLSVNVSLFRQETACRTSVLRKALVSTWNMLGVFVISSADVVMRTFA